MTLPEFIASVDQLPPTPAVLPKLLSCLGDVNTSPSEIVALIKVDPSLSAQVLRLSNSVYYGMATPSYDLDEAVNRIGFREVYKLVAIVATQDVLCRNVPGLKIDAEEIWETSLTAGLVMEQLARRIGSDVSDAYTCGLLHCLGKLALGTHQKIDYQPVFERVETEAIALHVAERAVFGFSSASAGAALLKDWGFQTNVTVPVEYQLTPLSAPTHRKLTSLLHLAIWMVASLGLNHGQDAWAIEADARTLKETGLSEADLHAVLVDAHSRLDAVKSLLAETTA